MQNPREPALWIKIGNESIWGRRGLIKSNTLWLPLGLVLFFSPARDSGLHSLRILMLFLSVVCWSLFSILVNDITDSMDDLDAGKQRWINTILPTRGIWVVICFAGTGIIFTLAAAAPTRALFAYIIALISGLTYSTPPARFKERGIAGLLCYSISTMFGFAVIPWAWFGHNPLLLILSGAAVFLDKWVNLHFHQIIDYKADSAANTHTYAVKAGIVSAQKSLKIIAGCATLSSALVLMYMIVTLQTAGIVLSIITFAAFCLIAVKINEEKKLPSGTTSLTRELPWFYLASTLTVFRLLPTLLFLTLAIQSARYIPVCCVVVFLLSLETWYSFRYRYY